MYQDAQGNWLCKLSLQWDAATELDLGHYVAAISRDGVKWQEQTVDRDDPSCVFLGLALGDSVYARVKAVDRGGLESDWENFNSGNPITMPTDIYAPDDPTGLTTYSRLKAVHLEWTNPVQKDLKHIEVWRNNIASWSGASRIAEIDGTSYTDPIGLLDSSFFYALKAVDRVLNVSDGTAWVLGNTDITAPDAATGLDSDTGTIIDADGHIWPYLDCTWTNSPTEDVQSHELEVQYYIAGEWQNPIFYPCPMPTNSLQISPVPGNVNYRVRVRAVDDAGLRSEPTAWSTGTTAKDNVAPATPTGLVVTVGIKTLKPSVDTPTEGDWSVTEFYASPSQGFTPGPSTLVHSGRVNSFTYNCPTYGRYYFRVRHGDSSGNWSGYCAEVSGVPSKVQDGDIPDNQIRGVKLVNKSVPNSKIIDVDFAKIKNCAIQSADIVSLVADKITAGTLAVTVLLEAVSIKAGTISGINMASTGTIGFVNGPSMHGSAGDLYISEGQVWLTNLIASAVTASTYVGHGGQTIITSGRALQNITAMTCSGNIEATGASAIVKGAYVHMTKGIGNPVGDIVCYDDIRPLGSGYKCGTAAKKWSDVYCGTLHEGDHHFEETVCPVCHRQFELGDLLAYYVVEVGKGTRAIPAHMRCIGSKERAKDI